MSLQLDEQTWLWRYATKIGRLGAGGHIGAGVLPAGTRRIAERRPGRCRRGANRPRYAVSEWGCGFGSTGRRVLASVGAERRHPGRPRLRVRWGRDGTAGGVPDPRCSHGGYRGGLGREPPHPLPSIHEGEEEKRGRDVGPSPDEAKKWSWPGRAEIETRRPDVRGPARANHRVTGDGIRGPRVGGLGPIAG